MYGTVTGADAYHGARENFDWSGGPAEKTAALLRGSDWLYGAYVGRYPAMPDPYVVPGPADPAVPLRVEYAAYEAAMRELLEPGSMSPDIDPSRRVKSESSSVGPISESVTYVDGGKVGLVVSVIEALMGPLAGSGSTGVFSLARA